MNLSRFDRNCPGRPDFFTGRAAVDEEALNEKSLRERNADLTQRLNQALMRASRAEDECRDLRAKQRMLEIDKPALKILTPAPVSRKAKPVSVTVPKIIVKQETCANDPLHPTKFKGGRVPRVLETIRDNPGIHMSGVARKLGVTTGAITFQVHRYSHLITKQRDGATVLLRIREGV